MSLCYGTATILEFKLLLAGKKKDIYNNQHKKDVTQLTEIWKCMAFIKMTIMIDVKGERQATVNFIINGIDFLKHFVLRRNTNIYVCNDFFFLNGKC